MLDADTVRVSQVISNLLNNAAKYTEADGQIWLSAWAEHSELVISVRDTGVGIPPEILPHVFEMFTQADGSLSRSQGGLGIGLTLSRSLVELHGGTIVARSAGAGRGSEFIVRLPNVLAKETHQEAEARGRAATNGQGSGRRILIVDDNVDSAESLSLWLNLEGYDVKVVHEGLAALEATRVFKPEVILLDIGLPDIDGYEVAERLRRELGLDGVRLIALTGYGQDEDRQRCYDAGFDEHLIKPVDPATLETLLSDNPSI